MEKINNRKLLFITIIILLTFNIISTLFYNKNIKLYVQLVDDLTAIIDKMPINMFESVLNEQILCYENELITIDSSMIIINDKGDKTTIENVPSDGDKLVIRYSKFGCEQCIDSIVTTVNRLMQSKSIVHFTFANNPQELKTYKQLNNINNKIYDVKKLNISIEDLNVPYLFVIDKQCKIKSLFIPHKEHPNQIESYIKIIRQKYFKNSQ